MPGHIVTEKYTVTISGKPKGQYWLAIQLFDIKAKKPVEIGLSEDLKLDHYFFIKKLTF